jgi:hypothetical protein
VCQKCAEFPGRELAAAVSAVAGERDSPALTKRHQPIKFAESPEYCSFLNKCAEGVLKIPHFTTATLDFGP